MLLQPQKCESIQVMLCFFYIIKVMGNVSNRILKMCIDITSFTNSLIQNYGLANPKFYLPDKEDLYLPCRV